MKEILVLAGFLATMLVVFWGVVVCLELLVEKGRKRGNTQQGRGGGGEGNHEDMVVVIIAGINAYEGFFKKEGTKTRRVIYRAKEEKTPLWRTKERIK